MKAIMKTNVFFGMLLMAFLTVAGLTACIDDNEEEGRKVTGYEEYMLTVASAKLPGVVTSSGSNLLADVYAVKKEQSAEWKAQSSLGKFEYEEGYEYQIRISETNYLDYNMGDPAWTEYELLEVISKEHKNSEDLPPHFIPNWYFEQSCPSINPDFAYAIEADKKEDIENDLKTDNTYKFGGLRYYVTFPVTDDWFLLDADMHTIEQGTLIRRGKDVTEFPESYKLLPPESQVLGHVQFDFVTNAAPDKPIMQYDVFICRQALSKSIEQQNVDIWLYKDLTAYYQSKYPKAGVKAVMIRYSVGKLDNYAL